MRAEPGSVEPIRAMIARLCPGGQLRIGAIDFYAGPNPHLPAAATIFSFSCRLKIAGRRDLIRERLSDLLGLALPEPPADRRSEAATFAELAAGAFTALVHAELGLHLRAGAIDQGKDRAALVIEDVPIVPQMLMLHVAIEAVILAVQPAPAEMPPTWAMLRGILERRRPNNESIMLIEAARRRGAAADQIGANDGVWRFGMGQCADLFWVTASNLDGAVGHIVSLDKHFSKQLLVRLGMPTPKWRRLGSHRDIEPAVAQVGWPCVIKPLDRGSGKGVYANIPDRAALRTALASALAHSKNLMLEAHEPGHDYRLMVVDGQLVMAVRRDPPAVEGDGISSIGVLIERLNAERLGSPGNPACLYPVPQDEGLDLALAAQDLTIHSVAAAGTRVILRTNANHSTGGTCTDVLERVHPTVARAAELLAHGFGLRVAGIDYITPDISRPHAEVGGGFIEINATPGVEVLITSQIVRPEIADLVLGARPGHIPVTLVLTKTGETARLRERMLDGLEPGSGISAAGFGAIGAYRLPIAPAEPAECVAALLRYPALQRLVVIWSVGELLEHGLPVERVERLLLADVKLEEEWAQLAARHCARIEEVTTTDECLTRLLREKETHASAR